MLTITDLNELLALFKNAKTERELHDALVYTTWRLGFTQFAMGHHVDLTHPPDDAVRLTNYNEDWISHVLNRGYFSDDPIHVASTKTNVGFLWQDVSSIIQLSPRQKMVLAEAVGFGLAQGFTVPVYLPGEYQGTCSFAAASLDGISSNALSIAQLCGVFAFNAARQIMKHRLKITPSEVPLLSTRQQEALIHIGRGKSDPEIGYLMNITRATAHEHVELVRRAYGNAQRPHLIARALFDGQITFSDLFRR